MESLGATLEAAVTDLNIIQREKHMSTPQLTGLAASLRDLKALANRVSSVNQQVASTLANGSGTVTQVETLHRDVSKALAEVQAELGTLTNGGPPLEDTFSKPVPAAPAALPDAGMRGDPPQH